MKHVKPALVCLFPHVGTVESSLLSGLNLLLRQTRTPTKKDVQRNPEALAIIAAYMRYTAQFPLMVEELRRICGQSYAVVAKGEGPNSGIHPYFGTFDYQLSSEVSLLEDGRTWTDQDFEVDWSSLSGKVSERHIIVAGFHFDDCVAKFAQAAAALGKYALLCPWVSNYFYATIATCRSFGTMPPYDIPLLCE